MRLEDYYRGLRGKERDSFAARAGTTRAYIEIHLLADPQRRKTPRRHLMERLASASQGKCSLEEVLAHFFVIAA